MWRPHHQPRTAGQHRIDSRLGTPYSEAWQTSRHPLFPTERPHCCPSPLASRMQEEGNLSPQALRPVNSRYRGSPPSVISRTCHPTWERSNRESEVLMTCWSRPQHHKPPLMVHNKMAPPKGISSPHLPHPHPSQPGAVKRGHRGVHRWRQSLEGGCRVAMRIRKKTCQGKNFFVLSHALSAARSQVRRCQRKEAMLVAALHRMQPPFTRGLFLPPTTAELHLRRQEQQAPTCRLRKAQTADRVQPGVRTQLLHSPLRRRRQELPAQQRERLRSLVVEAMLPPRTTPLPYRPEGRAQDHQHRQQRVNHQPPPPGSLRPRMVEQRDPRRDHQAMKETGSHRRLLLQQQPAGRHISPRRRKVAISHRCSRLPLQPI